MDLIHKFTPQIEKILNQNPFNLDDSLNKICQFLRTNVIHFDWVGFYFHNNEKTHLELKSFSGAPTEHKKIPFGIGVCGQVAVSNKKLIVPNVELEQNYLSCNINVKSEIVIPILVNKENIGQIDVDSNSVNPFTKNDIKLLEYVCDKIALKIKTLKYGLD